MCSNGQPNQESVLSKLFGPFVSERLLNIPVPSVYGATADEHPPNGTANA